MVAEHTRAGIAWSVGDAKDRFDEMIRLVEEGAMASIVKDGRVVAELKPVSLEAMTAEERQAAVDRFLEERSQWGPLDATLEEMMAWRHEGHRW